MEDKNISIIKVAKELKLHVKIVVSVKSYQSFNIIFNTHDEREEYSRRVVVLTKYPDLDEVYEEEAIFEIDNVLIKDGSAWIKTYPLVMSISKIDLKSIFISDKELGIIKEELLNLKI